MIYDFSLCSMYAVTGVDNAICYRSKLLKENNYDVKLIFTIYPTYRDLKVYLNRGVTYDQIIVIPNYFTGENNLEPVLRVNDMLKKLKLVLNYDRIDRQDNSVDLYRKGSLRASIKLDDDRDHFYQIEYWNKGWHERTDFYSSYRYMSIYFEPVLINGAFSASMSRRVFYKRDGEIAITQIVGLDEEGYLVADSFFNNGERLNDIELFNLFVEKLNLSKNDIVLLDRPIKIFPTKTLFKLHDKTNIVAYIHSEHYFEDGYTVEGIRLNREYWYWAKYSKYIDYFVTSTERQKEKLANYLKEHNLAVPEIKAIPIVGVDELRYPSNIRKKKAVVCVSRLYERKRIDWTIYAAIKAHRIDPEITLDIYGDGNDSYFDFLSDIIKKENAEGYISLKGHKSGVEKIYQNYELFITTSLHETFGITLLEAVSSGLPMVGLKVRYGNLLFIEENANGNLIEYNPEHFSDNCPDELEEFSSKIVDILNDKEKWIKYSEHSYKIASRFLTDKIGKKIVDFMKEIENKNL